jgi:hypothetical protein
MSVQDRYPRYAASSPVKPACEMTQAEWEAHAAEVDAERAKDGLRPLNWDLIPQPLPVTDELRETVLSMKLPGE